MKNVKTKPLNLIASLFGLGFIPFMPGTFGTLGAFGLYLILPAALFSSFSGWLLLGILLCFSLLAVFISGRAEQDLGTDAPQIVIDEMAGFFMATLFLPYSWLVGLYAVVLFRVFDIGKPLGVKSLQKLPGGWGIVADDILAGIYANILLQVLVRIYPTFFKV